MKIQRLLLSLLVLACFSITLSAQTETLIKRTVLKNDRLDFGVGGTLVVAGAPQGSIRIEGWPNREIEIAAEVEVQAANEIDLKRLADITTFVLEEGLGRVAINSVGTHDKSYIKRLDKKFPKHLRDLPFRIDYVIKVPQYTDIQVDGGVGDLHISGVEGTMKLNYLETNAVIKLVGGATTATFGKGSVEVSVPSASWRGRPTDIQLASGEMTVSLPLNINAEIDASILRTGTIENDYPSLKPRVRKAEFTEKSVVARSGVGGVSLKFTVGDGTLRLGSPDGGKIARGDN